MNINVTIIILKSKEIDGILWYEIHKLSSGNENVGDFGLAYKKCLRIILEK